MPEQQPHLHISTGDVGRYVLLPGDPARAEVIAARLDDPRLVAWHREFVTWTGTLHGAQVSVTSTGIGGPSTAIAVEELVKAGAHTFIRVGTSGAIQPDIDHEMLAIAQAAIRDEGTSSHYLPLEFPAVADFDVTRALRDAAAAHALPWRVGVVQSKDSYYGQHERERMPLSDSLARRWEAWTAGGALCSEMETATLFVVGSVLGVRAGAILHVYPLQGGRPSVAGEAPSLDSLIDVAVDAMSVLMRADGATT